MDTVDNLRVEVEPLRFGCVNCCCSTRSGDGPVMFNISGGYGKGFTLFKNEKIPLASIHRRKLTHDEFKVKQVGTEDHARCFDVSPHFRPPPKRRLNRYVANIVMYWKNSPRFQVTLEPGDRYDVFKFLHVSTGQQIAKCKLVEGDLYHHAGCNKKQAFMVQIERKQDAALCALLTFGTYLCARRARELAKND